MLTIQDFALYPQATCQLPSGAKDRLSGIDYLNNELFFENAYKTFSVYAFKAQDCKIVLRPLSSLTEAEAQELFAIYCGEEWSNALGGACLEVWWKASHIQGRIFIAMILGETAVWRWLLAHHFDLFGWIESGLAIDATSI